LLDGVVDVEVPVVQQRPSGATAQVLTIVGFEFELAFTTDVLQVFAHRLEVIAAPREHFHHRFWRSLDGPPYLLDLGRGEVPAGVARAAAPVGDQIEKRLLAYPKRPHGTLRSAN
jgi:hypothetical protein